MDRFDETDFHNDDEAASLAVSDHRPIWASFYVDKEDIVGRHVFMLQYSFDDFSLIISIMIASVIYGFVISSSPYKPPKSSSTPRPSASVSSVSCRSASRRAFCRHMAGPNRVCC